MMRRTTSRWFSRLALAAGLVAVLSTLLAPLTSRPAEAHATLIRSSPENGSQQVRAPLRVILYYSEPVEPRLTDVRVFDTNRNRVDEDDVEVDPNDRTAASVGVQDLPPGLYLVEFSNVSSVDGHPWTGVYQFIILNPDGTVPPGAEFNPDAAAQTSGTGNLPRNLDIALKWLALLSLSAFAGAAFWVLAVARTAAAFLDEERYRTAIDAAERWLARAAHVLLPVAFVAMTALVIVTINRFTVSTSVWSYLTSIQTGEYRLAHQALVVVALAGADVFYVAGRKRLREGGLLVALIASTGALLTYSLTSHGAAGDGSFWAVTVDFIHLAASAIWLGALVMLAGFTLWLRREATFERGERFLYMANVFDRFSALAGLSVILILATGTFNGLAQIPNPHAMVDTTYGRVLIAKLSLMMALLAVAAFNAFVLKPRLVETIDGLYQQGGASDDARRATWEQRLGRLQTWLPRTIIAEVVLVVAVFASVAVLTQTSTAIGELAQEAAKKATSTAFQDQKPAGDLQLEFDVRPNRVGINEFDLTVRNADDTLATDLSQVRLRFFYTDPSNPNADAGQAEVILREAGDGQYTGQGAYFTQPGTWRVEAGIRRPGADDVSRNFVVPVAPPEARSASDGGGRFDLPFTAFTWNEVAGAALVLAGVVIALYRRQLEGLTAGATRAILSGAAAMLLAGGVLIFGVDSHTTVANPNAGNPVEPTEASIARGRELFQNNCIVCHGVDGRGDGPQAASLDPSPSDFRLHMPLHTDPQFYAFIANGFPGSAMPAWREDFSEEDIWNLVNFLRATFTERPE
ncbi:MAG: CopD family protein [Dehalococcoidia bacterium]